MSYLLQATGNKKCPPLRMRSLCDFGGKPVGCEGLQWVCAKTGNTVEFRPAMLVMQMTQRKDQNFFLLTTFSHSNDSSWNSSGNIDLPVLCEAHFLFEKELSKPKGKKE